MVPFFWSLQVVGDFPVVVIEDIHVQRPISEDFIHHAALYDHDHAGLWFVHGFSSWPYRSAIVLRTSLRILLNRANVVLHSARSFDDSVCFSLVASSAEATSLPKRWQSSQAAAIKT